MARSDQVVSRTDGWTPIKVACFAAALWPVTSLFGQLVWLQNSRPTLAHQLAGQLRALAIGAILMRREPGSCWSS